MCLFVSFICISKVNMARHSGTQSDTHIPKGLEDVSSIFNLDCFQSTIHKLFCYRATVCALYLAFRYRLAPGFATTSLAGDVLEIWPHMDIRFAQHCLVIRPDLSGCVLRDAASRR